MPFEEGHYVYALTYADEILYVGKGSGYRLSNQMRAFGLDGHIIERCFHARKAYRLEKKYIAKHQPRLNQNAGGAGSGPDRKWPHPGPGTREDQWLNLPLDNLIMRCVAACPIALQPKLDEKINLWRKYRKCLVVVPAQVLVASWG